MTWLILSFVTIAIAGFNLGYDIYCICTGHDVIISAIVAVVCVFVLIISISNVYRFIDLGL